MTIIAILISITDCFIVAVIILFLIIVSSRVFYRYRGKRLKRKLYCIQNDHFGYPGLHEQPIRHSKRRKKLEKVKKKFQLWNNNIVDGDPLLKILSYVLGYRRIMHVRDDYLDMVDKYRKKK